MMMKKPMMLVWALGVVLAVAGCSSDDGSQADTSPAESTSSSPDAGGGEEGDELVDVTSGRPLSEFEGQPSYDWRKAIAEDKDRLLGELQAIAPHLEEKDFSDVLNTCDALARGLKPGQVVKDAVARFSGGPGEEVDTGQAEGLVDVAKEVCPGG